MLIEKSIEQPTLPMLSTLPKWPTLQLLNSGSFSALKIGCLLAGMGIGLLIGHLFCCATISDYYEKGLTAWGVRELASLIYGACVLGMGGIGLVIAFVVELKINKKENQ